MPHKTLGAEVDFTYEQALDAAEIWWRTITSGAPRGYDVLAALEDYARTKSANVDDPRSATVWRDLTTLGKHLSGECLGRELAELTTAELERWRHALPVKPATRRRVYTILAAALSRTATGPHGAGDPASGGG